MIENRAQKDQTDIHTTKCRVMTEIRYVGTCEFSSGSNLDSASADRSVSFYLYEWFKAFSHSNTHNKCNPIYSAQTKGSASIEQHSDETSAGLTTKKNEIVSRGEGKLERERIWSEIKTRILCRFPNRVDTNFETIFPAEFPRRHNDFWLRMCRKKGESNSLKPLLSKHLKTPQEYFSCGVYDLI